MMNKKTTKRALLLSALSILMCVSMLIGSTFAWFTDSVTSAGNKIVSGNLDVDLVDAYGASLSGEVIEFVDMDDNDLWEPGCTYKLEDVYVVNNGSLALQYEISINGITGDAKLLEVIEWTITVDGAETALDALSGKLLPGEKTKALVLTGHMKEDASNEYQGLTIENISISVFATQVSEESDSFDNTYDNLALVNTVADLKSAIANGEEVVLTSDIVFEDDSIVIDNDATIDLNGHTIFGTSSSASTSYLIKVEAGKEVTLKNGVVSFNASKPDTEWENGFPGYANNAISCHGSLIIDGATVENKTTPGGASYAIDCYPGANVIVEDGVINGHGKFAIRAFANSATTPIDITVNGGTITGKRAIWIQLPSNKFEVAPYVNVTVNGGTLVSTDAAGYYLALYSSSSGNSFKNVNVALNGGEFYGYVAFGGNQYTDKETVTVSDACVLNNEVYRYLANGTETIKVANSKNTVAVSNTGLKDAITDGSGTVVLASGSYTMPAATDKDFTISGTKDTEITINRPAMNGSNVTFDGVTVIGSGYATGIQHVDSVTYNNVTVNGEMCLYGEKVVFNNCTFNLNKGQYIWTYGAKDVEFNNCTFNTAGKAILVYNEGAKANTTVTVDSCTFNATAGDKAGTIANQNCAAIEIDSSFGDSFKLNLKGDNKLDSDFSGLWRIKGIKTAVTVNDVLYATIAIDGKTMTINDKNVTVH